MSLFCMSLVCLFMRYLIDNSESVLIVRQAGPLPADMGESKLGCVQGLGLEQAQKYQLNQELDK